MSNMILTDSQALDVERKASMTESLSRKLLFKQMAKLSYGRLHIIDESGEWQFGCSGDAEFECTMYVHDPRFYRRMLTGGSLAASEAFMDGDWSTDDLTRLLRLFIREMDLADDMDSGVVRLAGMVARGIHWLNANTRAGSKRNIAAHYDLGNDFFDLFLDDTMMYSSAVFESDDSTLHEASVAKLDRICRKLDLRPEHHVVEIGTGWGGFALHAAGQYGCRVTTTTISQEQYDRATQRVREAGLEDRVTLMMQDYRDLDGQYDRLVSIEMIEAVGHKYLPGFFGKCSELLKRDGMMAIQGITMSEQRYESYLKGCDFIQRYIFPGGCLPAVTAMGQAMAKHTDLRMLSLEDMAPHYGRTLKEWQTRFTQRLNTVRQLGYDEYFIRMWKYYLSYCEAAFAERAVGVCQLIAAKPACQHDPIRNESLVLA